VKEYKIVLGIEINNSILRAAEVEQREKGFFLSRIAEQPIAALDGDELAQKISYLINEEGILSRTVSIAVDTLLTQRDTVPVDSDMERMEITNFLNSEIEFHNNFNGGQYVPAYEVVTTPADGHKEVLYAAIKDDLLKMLRETCTRCGLDLQSIDLDHSCSELLVKRLQAGSKTYILLTVKNGQVEGSLGKNGHRSSYKYMPYSSEPFYPVTKMAQTLESTTKDYVERIYITGPAADSFLLDMLRKNVDDRYELVNPARNLILSPLATLNQKFQSAPQNFSAVIGAALK